MNKNRNYQKAILMIFAFVVCSIASGCNRTKTAISVNNKVDSSIVPDSSATQEVANGEFTYENFLEFYRDICTVVEGGNKYTFVYDMSPSKEVLDKIGFKEIWRGTQTWGENGDDSKVPTVIFGRNVSYNGQSEDGYPRISMSGENAYYIEIMNGGSGNHNDYSVSLCAKQESDLKNFIQEAKDYGLVKSTYFNEYDEPSQVILAALNPIKGKITTISTKEDFKKYNVIGFFNIDDIFGFDNDYKLWIDDFMTESIDFGTLILDDLIDIYKKKSLPYAKELLKARGYTMRETYNGVTTWTKNADYDFNKHKISDSFGLSHISQSVINYGNGCIEFRHCGLEEVRDNAEEIMIDDLRTKYENEKLELVDYKRLGSGADYYAFKIENVYLEWVPISYEYYDESMENNMITISNKIIRD